MSKLKDNLEEMLNQRTSIVKPENIRLNKKLYGVTGTLDAHQLMMGQWNNWTAMIGVTTTLVKCEVGSLVYSIITHIGTITMQSGWTLLEKKSCTNGSTTFYVSIYYKVATSITETINVSTSSGNLFTTQMWSTYDCHTPLTTVDSVISNTGSNISEFNLQEVRVGDLIFIESIGTENGESNTWTINLSPKDYYIQHWNTNNSTAIILIKNCRNDVKITCNNNTSGKLMWHLRHKEWTGATVLPEHIKKGINVFDVIGTLDVTSGTEDATATASDLLLDKTAYANGVKLIGSMPNNGEIEIKPSDELQIIPSGYIASGKVSAVDITDLTEYNECLELSTRILTDVDIPYIPLKYIESTGTQYIDTRISVSSNTLVDIVYEESGDIIDYERLFGGTKDYFELVRNYTEPTKWYPVVKNTTFNGEMYIPIGKNRVKFGQGQVVVNGEVKHTYSGGSFAGYLYIFYSYNGDRKGSFKLYSFQVYSGQTLVRDMVPVIRKSDSVVCLFDKVSKSFFVNKGTGNFIAGGVD